jgi:putative phage-type endonuclease
VEQNTDEWLSWRMSGVGASESAAIMGDSPWLTPRELFNIKKGRSQGVVSNWAIERGNILEPVAKARFEILNGLEFEPKVFESKTHPFIRASLDGHNTKTNTALEIKVAGLEVYEGAKEGKVPQKYIWQLEQQAYASGVNLVYFYVYFSDKQYRFIDDAVVPYRPNPELREKLIENVTKFWRDYVQKDIAPDLVDRDVEVLDDQEAVFLVRDLKKALEARENFSKRLETVSETLNGINDRVDEIKEELLKLMNTNRAECLGVRLTKRKKKSGYSLIAKVREDHTKGTDAHAS